MMAELFNPGRGVKAIARNADIGQHTELKYFGAQNLSLKQPALQYFHCRRHCFNPFSAKYLDHKYPSPMAEITLTQHLAKLGEPLWWHVVVASDTKTKAVVRSKAQVKTRRAFSHALRLEGYDRTGKRPDESPAPDGEGGAARVRPADDLHGTCGIVIKDAWEVVDTDFPNLVEVMRSLVVRLREAQRPPDEPRERGKWTTGGGLIRKVVVKRHNERKPDRV
jgi:hypothetical protein